MKRLYVVRHSEASWDDKLLSDYDRHLKKEGVGSNGNAGHVIMVYFLIHVCSMLCVCVCVRARVCFVFILFFIPFTPFPFRGGGWRGRGLRKVRNCFDVLHLVPAGLDSRRAACTSRSLAGSAQGTKGAQALGHEGG